MQSDIHLVPALDLTLRCKSPPPALTPFPKTWIAVSSRHGTYKLHYPCGRTDIVSGLSQIRSRWDLAPCATTEHMTRSGMNWLTVTCSNCSNFCTLSYKKRLTLYTALYRGLTLVHVSGTIWSHLQGQAVLEVTWTVLCNLWGIIGELYAQATFLKLINN